MKKKILLIMSLFAALLLVAACGNGEAGTDALRTDAGTIDIDPTIPRWQQVEREERVTLTWFVNEGWWNTSWGEDFVTRTIQEMLNIEVEFIAGGEEELNLLFAGGDIPDIMTLTGGATSQAAMNAPRWAYSLNELAQKYDPYFLNVASADSLNWFELEDGNTYAYPNFSNSWEDFDNDTIPASTAFLIRRDVYEAIGDVDMTTPEGFLAGLEVISEQFPELTPLGGVANFGETLQNLLGVPLLDGEGNFNNRNLDEDYLTWMRTLRTAHDRGFISDDSFVNDGAIWDENVEFGNYATIVADNLTGMSNVLQRRFEGHPGGEYIAIDALRSTVGNAPTLQQAGLSGWLLNFISQGPNADVAIELFTFLLSDFGQTLTFYGLEGETFEWTEDGMVSVMPHVKELQDTDREAFNEQYRFGEFFLFGHDRWNALNATAWPDAVLQPMEWGRGQLRPQFIIENINPEWGTNEARSLDAINTEWERIRIELVRASSDADFDALIAEYEAFLRNNNWDSIQEIRNAGIERNRGRLDRY